MLNHNGNNGKLQQAHVRASGEHYVLARLTSFGLIAGLAPENNRSVDIVATPEFSDKSLQIEVKTRTVGRASDDGWHMHKKHESIVRPNLFYVFVAMPASWTDDSQPETYIIPSKKVAQVLKKTHQDWLNTPGKKGQKRNNTDMRRILPFYKDSPSIPRKWMSKYKDNWSFLQD
ncbi:MAG TPA: hypothetical protein VHP63_07275 [candidate division Zixibacteria bacterium]|nr:hypothetical protein [candidate division Zixibacteria bacterium]